MYRAVVVLASLAVQLAWAASPPSPAEAKKVIEYYYGGKDAGPLLVELKPCLKVDAAKESPTRNECLEPVVGAVKKNTQVHAWTMWLVPEGGSYDDVTLQYLFEGQVRSSIDLQLTSALRSRTVRSNVLSKAGKWEIKVVRRGKELGSVPVTVE